MEANSTKYLLRREKQQFHRATCSQGFLGDAHRVRTHLLQERYPLPSINIHQWKHTSTTNKPTIDGFEKEQHKIESGSVGHPPLSVVQFNCNSGFSVNPLAVPQNCIEASIFLDQRSAHQQIHRGVACNQVFLAYSNFQVLAYCEGL